MHIRGKSKRISKVLRPALCLLLSAVLLIPSLLPAKADSKDQFKIDINYGFEGKIEQSCYIPVNITVENLGKNFEGRVQIIVPSETGGADSGPTMYEKDLNIVAGTQKTITFTVFAHNNLNSMNVRIVNKKEKVLATKFTNLVALATINSVNIGVLSDDFSALSYFNKIPVLINSNGITVNSQLLELTSDSFPEDSRTLDMMDIILISNYSTDKLSAAQLSSLDTWVRNGGTLIVGTGSTVTKTLSGLKELPSFRDVKSVGSVTFEKHQTLFGLSTNNINTFYTEDYSASGQYGSAPWVMNVFYELNPESQSKFMSRFQNTINRSDAYKNLDIYSSAFDAMLKDFFESNEDFIRKEFCPLFIGYSPDDSQWASYYKSEIFGYIDEITKWIYPSLTSSNEKNETNFTSSPVTAEFANITVPKSIISYQSEDVDTSKDFAMVRSFSYGSGIVAIAGVDFTQNPLISFPNKAEVAKGIIKTSVPSSFIPNLNNYMLSSSYYGYRLSRIPKGSIFSNIFSQLDSAAVPPVLLYTFILILYLISIFVSYSKLKKKGKTVWFWLVQVASALAFSLVILMFSMSTRLFRAELRTASFNQHTGNETNVSEVSTLVMPKKRTYTIELNNSHAPERYNYENSYGYGYYNTQGSNLSLDSYYIGIHNKAQSTAFTVKNRSPLNSENFFSEYTDYEKANGFTVKFNDGLSLSITNNTGKDLEKAYIVAFSCFYPLKNFKDGETKVIDSNSAGYLYPAQTDQYYSYALTGSFGRDKNPIYTYLFGNGTVSFKELFLGAKNSAFIERRMPLALYKAVVTNFWDGTADCCLVGGTAKAPAKTDLQTESKAKEINYEYHYQLFTINRSLETVEPVTTNIVDDNYNNQRNNNIIY